LNGLVLAQSPIPMARGYRVDTVSRFLRETPPQ
jgi:hypothetical protein